MFSLVHEGLSLHQKVATPTVACYDRWTSQHFRLARQVWCQLSDPRGIRLSEIGTRNLEPRCRQ